MTVPSPPGSPYLTTAEAIAALQQAAVSCNQKAAGTHGSVSAAYAATGWMLSYLAEILQGTA